MSEYDLQFIHSDEFETCQISIKILTDNILRKADGIDKQVIGPMWWKENKTSYPPTFTPLINAPVDIGRNNLIKIDYAAYKDDSDEHTIIFVRNDMLPHKWALFDADGKDGLKDILPPNGVLQINLGRREPNKSTKEIIDNHAVLTPEETINTSQGYKEDLERDRAPEDDGDNYNKGFCGLFVLIFLCFYYKNKDNPGWWKCWILFLNKMKLVVNATYYDEDGNKRGHQSALMATYFAQEVYRIIKTDYSHIDFSYITLDRRVSDYELDNLINIVNQLLVDYFVDSSDPDICLQMSDGYDMSEDEDMDMDDEGGLPRRSKRLAKKGRKKQKKCKGTTRKKRSSCKDTTRKKQGKVSKK